MYLFLVYVCLVYIQRMEGLFWMDFRLTIYLWKIFERTRNNLFKNGELFELVNSLYLVILWRFLLLFDCSVGWVSVKWVIWWIWWEGNTLCIGFFFFYRFLLRLLKVVNGHNLIMLSWTWMDQVTPYLLLWFIISCNPLLLLVIHSFRRFLVMNTLWVLKLLILGVLLYLSIKDFNASFTHIAFGFALFM